MLASNDTLIADINGKLKEYIGLGYHVPGVTVITECPEFMRPSLRIVQIDSIIEQGKKSNDEIYSVSGGKYGFGRLAIQKFADAGRINLKILGTPSVVKGKDVARYSAKVSGERYDLDGAPKRAEDEKTYDLIIREEEMRIKYTTDVEKEHSKWTPERKATYVEMSVRKVMVEKSKFASEMAITGAQARVVTKMLGLKAAYTLAELKKPFVIVAMTPIVDMHDPDIKRMVTAHMLGVSETLYSPPPSISFNPVVVNHEEAEITAVESEDISALPANGPVPGPSLSDFEDCPRSTKVSILRRLVSDEGVKDRLGQLEDEALTMLYEQRRAA